MRKWGLWLWCSVPVLKGKHRKLCGACFNKEVSRFADLAGLQHIQFEPVVMTDVSEVVQEFHFQTHLIGTHVAVRAFDSRYPPISTSVFQTYAQY